MSRQVTTFEFGPFKLDAAEGLLWFERDPVPLEPQVVKTLLALVGNNGRLCEKGWLMEQVWGETAVEEGSLARNISVLRKALGDGYIQTVPKRGYRFVAEVRELPEANGELLIAERTRSSLFIEEEEISGPEESNDVNRTSAYRATEKESTRTMRLLSRWPRWALAGLGLVGVGVSAVWVGSSPPPLKVSGYTQVTNDGQQKTGLVTDGSRLYISELVENKPTLVQVSTAGGETVPLVVPFQNPGLDDVSPNGSELFVASNDGPYPFPYWLVPVSGGSPRPLVGIRAHDVHPSPDGKSIAYVVKSDLCLARMDGSQTRKLVTLPEQAGRIAWSPDGTRLRFTMRDPGTTRDSIWEVLADGSNLHRLLPGWNESESECCGSWTADGKYFVFEATSNGVSHLWAVREEGSFLRKVNREPVQLSTGPIQFRLPVPSKDGRKIYAVGDHTRGEIMRYEARSQEWIPYQQGKSIVSLDFTLDGQMVAYVAYPEGTLWRSNVDGSRPQQLTFPPMEVNCPSWSPDKKSIVFMARMPGQQWKIYTVSSMGGQPEQLMARSGSEAFPHWSPDGKRIVFGGSPFFGAKDVGPTSLQILDLTTKQVSELPNSDGSFEGRWSPDGRYLVTLQFDFKRIILFDLSTGKRQELANGVLHFASWSRDGKYVYFEKWGTDTAACRIRISDGTLEKMGSLKQFRRTVGTERCWSGIAPDDSLLVLRDIGSQEVYALGLELP